MLAGLAAAGFAAGPGLRPNVAGPVERADPWTRAVRLARRVLSWRVALRHVDAPLTRLYRGGVHLLYTQPGQVLLAALAVAGLIAFVLASPAVTLSPGAAVRTHLAVHPPAGAAPTARGQPVTVQVTSEDDQTIRASAVVILTVGTDPELRLDVVAAEARGRSPVVHSRLQRMSSPRCGPAATGLIPII
jgi:hypothetical protein